MQMLLLSNKNLQIAFGPWCFLSVTCACVRACVCTEGMCLRISQYGCVQGERLPLSAIMMMMMISEQGDV